MLKGSGRAGGLMARDKVRGCGRVVAARGSQHVSGGQGDVTGLALCIDPCLWLELELAGGAKSGFGVWRSRKKRREEEECGANERVGGRDTWEWEVHGMCPGGAQGQGGLPAGGEKGVGIAVPSLRSPRQPPLSTLVTDGAKAPANSVVCNRQKQSGARALPSLQNRQSHGPTTPGTFRYPRLSYILWATTALASLYSPIQPSQSQAGGSPRFHSAKDTKTRNL